MLALKILLVFYIFDIVLMFNFKKLYKTTVTGQFFCKYSLIGFYTISIQQKSFIYKETTPISVLKLPYGSEFTLKGRLESYRKPSLYVKVVHDCSPPRRKCLKLFTKDISRNCIRKKGSTKLVKQSFDLGATDLTSYSAIYLNCYRKKGSM